MLARHVKLRVDVRIGLFEKVFFLSHVFHFITEDLVRRYNVLWVQKFNGSGREGGAKLRREPR